MLKNQFYKSLQFKEKILLQRALTDKKYLLIQNVYLWFFFFLLADYLGHKLSVAWEEECNKKQMKHKEPSLVKAVLKVFGLRFAALGFVLLILELGLR